MFKKRINNDEEIFKKIDKEIEQEAFDFATCKRFLLIKSNRRAWFVAFIFAVLFVISVIIIACLFPLKTVVPYVIKVDKTTGYVEIIDKLDVQNITQNEAMDKYFVGNYVKKREEYFYNLLSKDYFDVQLLSSDNVAEEYRKIYRGADSRTNKLKNDFEVRVKLISIVLNKNNIATVRFNVIKQSVDGNIVSDPITKVATLSYKYEPSYEGSEESRLSNPLGFKVISYRIDNEVSDK